MKRGKGHFRIIVCLYLYMYVKIHVYIWRTCTRGISMLRPRCSLILFFRNPTIRVYNGDSSRNHKRESVDETITCVRKRKEKEGKRKESVVWSLRKRRRYKRFSCLVVQIENGKIRI